ncbi:MAG: GNAT family N-acetyltransferase [Chloroflexota bacterium]
MPEDDQRGGEPQASHGPEPILNVRGERVALGPLRRDLVPLYTRWINDPQVLRTLGVLPLPMTTDAEERWYDAAIAGAERHFTIYRLEGMDAIGVCDLRDIDHRNRAASLGILIGDAENRGQGYGTEALRLLLDVGFTVLGLHNISLSSYSYNLAGQRCYARVGFREVGRRRECRLLNGVLHDEIYMDMLATEFTSPVLARIFAPDVARHP